MATISKDIVLDLLRNNGTDVLGEDPLPVGGIWQYTNLYTGEPAYSICYTQACLSSLFRSVQVETCLWNPEHGVTPFGQELLDGQKINT